ncbi:hypothetical protein K470DRAFT_209728 [Piedraia hortae CBS 480.64]|uniref:Uncharacterized protein n=1 Tax=Piedraia hortae CBS 480.64 TaxID=1314780 RepID=A0A6A7C9H0_9PEZI|nr:hypothetical protein K470DRAFT_209728 [Piedraia hortae CBS 480.64]
MSTFVPPGGPTWQPPEGGWPSSMTGRLHSQTVFKNAYSQSGFDMLSILMRVATRPNPEIQIGAVDMSCAFVVSDAEQEDLPIVYCSESFERLTGYTKDMLLGINCRFLQSPDGRVQAGEQRRYVDGRTVYYLKKKLLEFRETQVSLINYRRGGQPFMNLLTMIPISWDSDDVKYFVGFQVDLVEQPGAVTEQNPDGTYNINYQRSAFMPPYIKAAPHMPANPGPAVTPVQVSAMLAGTVVPRQLWHRVVLENVDDVVQVLSPKGIFQRLFPAAERVLEYMPGELIGTALSAVCHPSDIVSVTRELREMNNGSSIHVLFRIRRKHNGYMWFDCHGMLKAELQVKDRRFIVLFGRERPVYRLRRAEITASGGIGDNELWTKLSTSGILLFVSSHVKQLLDRQPEELIGTRIQNIMRPESENLFGNKLKQARHGQRTSVKHEMINRRGQVLSAHTVLYPGDGTTKPAFLIAQTRFHKFNRNTATNRDRMSTSDAGSHSLSTHSSIRSSLDGGQQTPKSIFNTNNNKSTQTFVQSTEEDENGNLFEELSVTKPSAWQYEIRQLEKRNRAMAEEVQMLIAAKKRRKRRKNSSNITKDCAHCHTKVTPEWRRGPSGQRDLCNSCGLRWAKSV